MQNIGPEIQVACAIIWCKDHILLSYRDVDAHQGGLWEFPGGKFEPNELPVQCLSRELHEELGIQIGDAYFVCQIPWSYGDKKIRLWVYEVFDFAGVAEGRESQEIEWVHRDALYKRPFPAANMSIVRAVGLPRFARFFGVDRTIAPAFWASQLNNQSLVYFRGVPPSDRLIGGIDAALDHGHSVILTLDQLPCFRIGCGVHFRKSDHPDEVYKALDRVEKPWPVTAGIRNRNDWLRQRDFGVDAFFISPVGDTPSHPGMPALGWSGFQLLAEEVGVPSYALGGMQLADLVTVTKHSGYGVAGIRQFQ